MRKLSRASYFAAITCLIVLIPAIPLASGFALDEDETDPARGVPLPCEAFSTPGLTPQGRSNFNIIHLANVCGIVGTDVEFQSRRDSVGIVHDYAFVGTMGAGFRIFDVTDPAHPVVAGGYFDSGWQNDIQVRGDLAVSTFDGVSGEDSSASTCLKKNYPSANGQGVDIFRLNFNAGTARFNPSLLTCVANPPGGAHNSTINPTGAWLALSNPSSDWAVDVIDLSRIGTGQAVHTYRLIDESRATAAGRCPTTAGSPTCVVVKRPDGSSASGLFRPHDVHFSRDGNTMYVAALNSTFIMNVSGVLSGTASTISIIPNISESGGIGNPKNIQLSHQADVTPDNKILVIADERGGGLSETGCNTDTSGSGVLGALHFWALADMSVSQGSDPGHPPIPQSAGASPASPKKIGSWFNPNPSLLPDVLGPIIANLPISVSRPNQRLERGCTVHVFRIGGNGSSSPGSAVAGLDGFSRLPSRQLVTGFYGAGVWQVEFWRGPSTADGTPEDARSTWGNTLAWNVQFGSETWSAKEYKGHIYAGDMLRGFDVYACSRGGTSTLCPQDPVVVLTKTGPVTAKRALPITYTLTYRNAGPAAAQGAKITDTLPTALTYISSTPRGTYDPSTRRVTWDLGTIPAGGRGSVQLTALVSPSAKVGTAIVNQAQLTAQLTVSPPAAAATVVVP